MSPALGILLALLSVEGLLLVCWPVKVRAVIQQTPDKLLRIAGLVEILVVLVILAFRCRCFLR